MEKEDLTAGTHGCLSAALFFLTLLSFDVFIYLPFFTLLGTESKLALNENRDDLNEKKKANATPAATHATFHVWTKNGGLFVQPTLDVSTKHLNPSLLSSCRS